MANDVPKEFAAERAGDRSYEYNNLSALAANAWSRESNPGTSWSRSSAGDPGFLDFSNANIYGENYESGKSPATGEGIVGGLVKEMGRFDQNLASDFGDQSDGGAQALGGAIDAEQTMLQDRALNQNTGVDSQILRGDDMIAEALASVPGGEQMMSQFMQGEQSALATLCGGDPPNSTPIQAPGSDTPISTPTSTPGGNPPDSTPAASGDTPTPTTPSIPGGGGGGDSPTPPGSATDMSSLFSAGDSGVTSAEMQHAVQIADQLPSDIQQALIKGGVKMTLNSGYKSGAQGENSGSQGDFYVDSGMADQAEVHELYEMAGQVSGSKLGGTWNDPQAVALADQAMQGNGPDPGDLSDTVGKYQGDGDLMSNAFVADFFATHAGLDQDTVGQSVLQATNQAAAQLEAYIAQQQGLSNASQA
ncbi:MAG TPA: hypothetical protein V6C72_03685 [Chroococcales cyanobacterium]